MAEERNKELLLDIEELKELLAQAKRPRVQQAMRLNLIQLEGERAKIPVATPTDENAPLMKEKKPVVARPKCYNVQIKSYAWDQSDSFVKLYVTLEGVHAIPAENVTCTFTQNSMELVANELNGKNHILKLVKLMNSIQNKASYYKVKEDKVVVFMKKEKSQHWSHLIPQDKKERPKPEMKDDGVADPSAGLMDLMRQMYEEGDDEMKRTIAKAWTESREKGAAGGGYDI